MVKKISIVKNSLQTDVPKITQLAAPAPNVRFVQHVGTSHEYKLAVYL